MEFRPVNPERPLKHGDKGRDLLALEAVNPASVVCAEAIFANAATTLGIPLAAFYEEREEVNGVTVRKFVWHLESKAVAHAVPRYTLKQLAQWWESEEWLRANPGHELAIVKAVSDNLRRFAERARTQAPLVKIRNGKRFVLIPTNATPERRAELMKEIE